MQNLSGIQGIWNLTVSEACAYNWTDPTSHILNSLNTIAFPSRAPLESNRIELLNNSNSAVESNFYIGIIRLIFVELRIKSNFYYMKLDFSSLF
jgi:hypothetical protein